MYKDYSLLSINSISYWSIQNVELLQNEDSSANSKKQKMMKLSNDLDIPKSHWSISKLTIYTGVIKEIFSPKLKLHQYSWECFKANSMLFFWRNKADSEKQIALKEIRHYQKSTSPLISHNAMSKVIRDIVQSIKADLYILLEAYVVLYLIVELFIIH